MPRLTTSTPQAGAACWGGRRAGSVAGEDANDFRRRDDRQQPHVAAGAFNRHPVAPVPQRISLETIGVVPTVTWSVPAIGQRQHDRADNLIPSGGPRPASMVKPTEHAMPIG